MAKEDKSRKDGKDGKEGLLKHRALIKKRKPDFLRHKWFRSSSVGKGRKKKQKWRQPIGRHNKLREKRKSRGRQPSVGYSSPRHVRGTLAGMKPMVVRNVSDLNKIKNIKNKIKESGEDIIAFLASVGMKKKIEIAKKALEVGVEFVNFNPKNFLKKAEEQLEARKKERKVREEKIKQRIEKAKKAKEKKQEKPETKETKPEEGKLQETKEEKETKEEREIIKSKIKNEEK